MATIVNQKKAIQSLTKEIDDLKMRNNSLLCGRMAQSPQCSQFVRAPQFVPQGPNQFSYHHSSRVVRARAARLTPYDQTRGPPSYS